MTTLPVRDEQSIRTRQRIVRAVADLMVDGHPATLSVPAVAKEAGVSVRTVYRYFPTKEQLLDGLIELGGELSRELMSEPPETFATTEDHRGHLEDYLASLPEIWSQLHENAGYLRAQATNPILRDTRSRRIHDRRERVEAGLRAIDGISPDDAGRLSALIQVLGSGWSLLDLVDECGLETKDAAALVQWAISVLIEAARNEHDSSERTDPEP